MHDKNKTFLTIIYKLYTPNNNFPEPLQKMSHITKDTRAQRCAVIHSRSTQKYNLLQVLVLNAFCVCCQPLNYCCYDEYSSERYVFYILTIILCSLVITVSEKTETFDRFLVRYFSEYCKFVRIAKLLYAFVCHGNGFI